MRANLLRPKGVRGYMSALDNERPFRPRDPIELLDSIVVSWNNGKKEKRVQMSLLIKPLHSMKQQAGEMAIHRKGRSKAKLFQSIIRELWD